MLKEASKVCFKCGELRLLSMFYRHSGMKDGHLNKCKECNKIDVRLNRLSNKNYYDEYDRKRGRIKNSLRNNATRLRAKLPKAKELRIVTVKQYKEIYPERLQARNFISNSIRDNKIIKPCNCEYCGKECKTQAHHSSYSKEMWSIITWLCSSCHGEVHRLYE